MQSTRILPDAKTLTSVDIVRYNGVFNAVEPKRAKLDEAQSMLGSSKAKLFEKQSRLAEVESQVT